MKLKRIFSFFISCLFLLFISFESYAAVQSSSNAVMSLSLDDDYGISLYSSVGTAVNTIDWSGVVVQIAIYDTELKITNYANISVKDYSSAGMSFNYSLDGTAWDNDKYVIRKLAFILKKPNLPVPGNYLFSMDVSSQFSYEIYSPNIYTSKNADNASTISDGIDITEYDFASGDFAVIEMGINLTNVNLFMPNYWIYANSNLRNLDFTCRIGFTPSSGNFPSTVGTDTSQQDFQYGVSNTLNQIDDSLQELIQHISNQLASLWDQMYNLMHVPTMAKLDEILSALRAIANNSDIYAVVEEIDSSSREQTSQIVQNANENTSKVEQAVEKHGNFIIDGLKGLFIPSDEYFKSYFDDLYTFFSDRFGFLSFPIDLLQRLADLFINSDDVDCVLTLPSFEISGEQLLIAQSFNLTEFLETNFSMLLSAIRIVGDCIIIGAFVNLCSNKWDEVMKN